MASTIFRAFKFSTEVWDPSHRFETSWLLTPWMLFAVRATISLYTFFVLLFSIFWQIARAPNGPVKAQFEFSYFTILCYWGLAFYFLTSSIHTYTYARYGTPLLTHFPRPLQALHSLFHTTIISYPILVTLVYWGILFRSIIPTGWFPVPFDAFTNISEHAFNTLFALSEILLTRTNPPPWIHLPCLIVLLALYLGLAYVTVATKHVYVYGFLNPEEARNGLVAAYVFGIAVGICAIFCVVKGLVAGRKWVVERRMGWEGRFFARRSWEEVDVGGEAVERLELEGGNKV